MKNCTIIIPTYNHPKYLNRILSYYDKYGGNPHIIVTDSSNTQKKEANKKVIKSFQNLTITYLNYFSPERFLYYKIKDSLDYCTDEYCVICGDDDFITPSGINQSIDFLNENPDFTVARGHNISYYLKNNTGKQQFHYFASSFTDKSVLFPDAESRLFSHLSNYNMATFYGVHRTDFQKMIFNEYLKFTDDVFFSELILTLLASIYGKMKHLDILYGAREYVPADLIVKKYEGFKDFMKNGTYDERYEKFRNCISYHLSQNSKLDKTASQNVVDKAMDLYLKKVYGHEHDSLVLINRIKNSSTFKTYHKIKSRYKPITTTELQHDKDSTYQIDENPKYSDEFNKIRSHVLLHSNL